MRQDKVMIHYMDLGRRQQHVQTFSVWAIKGGSDIDGRVKTERVADSRSLKIRPKPVTQTSRGRAPTFSGGRSHATPRMQ